MVVVAQVVVVVAILANERWNKTGEEK